MCPFELTPPPHPSLCKVAWLSCFSLFIQTLVFLCQANKIMEHRRKYERKREEKLIREKQERIKKAREEHARAQRVRSERAYTGPHNKSVLPNVKDQGFFTCTLKSWMVH